MPDFSAVLKYEDEVAGVAVSFLSLSRDISRSRMTLFAQKSLYPTIARDLTLR